MGRFALASGIVFVLIAVGLSMFASKDLTRQAERSAQFHSVFVADRVMRYALEDAGTGDDFEHPAHPRAFNRLDALVRSRILAGPGQAREGLRALGGRSCTPTNRAWSARGSRASPTRRSSSGAVVSEVTDLDEQENIFERALAPRLYSTYTPLWLGGDTSG